ncbi:MAG: hypothetical protein K6G44_14695 [Lentisphaeria bacterium]|jgi:hypothetical protein|nr:hypothetical protein [Lentisphaeria bacterium]
MKVIGIGGAGGKLAAKMDAEHAILVNVSETELDKVSGGGEHIVAPVQSTAGQFRGSRKDPLIGHDAYNTIRRRMQDIISGAIVFSSTGGGTGNGITTGILEDIIARDDSLESSNGIPINEKTMFALVLPDYEQESNYVENSIDFMSNPVANAIDKGSTGNIMLFSNKLKFDDQIGEDAYNQMIVDSLNVFMAIPEKNTNLKLLELHIDHEDFTAYTSKPYFNHFCYFDYDQSKDFGAQLAANWNKLLLPPEEPIEAMFLLEVPSGMDHTMFYKILPYFEKKKVTPFYSVVENPSLQRPFITVSLLYSRKPLELIDEFNKVNQEVKDAKVNKSLDQHVVLQKLDVDMKNEAKRASKEKGLNAEEVLTALKRINKL